MSVIATELFALRLTLAACAATRTHHRRYAIQLTQPNPNPPPAMELDINPEDGYELIARGELAKGDETMLPAPPSEHELERPERSARGLPIKRPLAPRRCSVSKTQPKNHRLGSISPTCSGTRFPDYPKPDSPPSVKKAYDDFVKSIEEQKAERAKQSEEAAALPVRLEGPRHPSAVVTPARQRASQVKPRVVNSEPVVPALAMPARHRVEHFAPVACAVNA
ncbi:unnamed protein product [Peniophora sp. CBMAI 1063]|nr:unnamed protein product [Peniophora sp. CBMAI 1063]